MVENNDIYNVRLYLENTKNNLTKKESGITSSDFFLNIPIIKTGKKIEDYVNVEKDVFKTQMERQNINPLFIELSFFNSIKYVSRPDDINILTYATEYDFIETKANKYFIQINK